MERYHQSSFSFDTHEDTPVASPEALQHARVHEEYIPYLDVEALRQYAASGEDLRLALRYTPELTPSEVTAIVDTLKLLLTPLAREQIKSPKDIAALLMIDMGFLQQEQFKVACLDTKNRVQKIHMVYQGSLDTAMIRVGEVFIVPLKLNSAAVILAHNHPSSDPTPSPEDVLITREIVSAGKLLHIEVLDHLVIGEGRFVSLREKGMGFDRP